ncbi:hypothetical protein B0H15DRAFT_67202 [Mycena belliarum]|uniref:Uncharacterized protein n=1 Tax=Mycena belliarum TaxID=1033014 RepID=A0AAD6UB68_9AGAR|nr:hypothetical protein B0H15DRAFT_67202 [Mycena belliae]
MRGPGTFPRARCGLVRGSAATSRDKRRAAPPRASGGTRGRQAAGSLMRPPGSGSRHATVVHSDADGATWQRRTCRARTRARPRTRRWACSAVILRKGCRPNADSEELLADASSCRKASRERSELAARPRGATQIHALPQPASLFICMHSSWGERTSAAERVRMGWAHRGAHDGKKRASAFLGPGTATDAPSLAAAGSLVCTTWRRR